MGLGADCGLQRSSRAIGFDLVLNRNSLKTLVTGSLDTGPLILLIAQILLILFSVWCFLFGLCFRV